MRRVDLRNPTDPRIERSGYLLLLTSILVGATTPAPATEVPFASQDVITTTAVSVYWPELGDLDGDGDLDLVTASWGDDEIAWYEHIDGAGSFGTEQSIGTGAGAATVHLADLDDDGDLDVIAGFQIGDDIVWYENSDGAGNFVTAQTIPSVGGPSMVIAADLDGDGDPDLLFSSITVSKIAWYENSDGAGTFGALHEISTEVDQAWSVAAADVDGDGDLDVLSASGGDNKIAWYANTDGAGLFGGQQIISTDVSEPIHVVAADVDGDGDLDALSTSQGDSKVAWYPNTDGAGTFGLQQVISTEAAQAVWMAVEDLDLDGDLDVLSASSADDKVAWYENTDGVGSFGSQQVISTDGSGALFVSTYDLDRDGDPDVLAASLNDSETAWYENLTIHRIARFPARVLIDDSLQGIAGVDAADLDGDGDLDYISASNWNDKIVWYPNTDGSGTFGTQQLVWAAVSPSSIFTGDVNGDGHLDVLSASVLADTVAWYPNDGTGSFGSQQIIASDALSSNSVFAADVDGDADLDVLAIIGSFVDEIVWYRNLDGAGSFGIKQVIATADDPTCVVAADLDGDGDPDVLSGAQYGDTLVWYENLDGAGNFGTPRVISSEANDNAENAFAADVDGDGDIDVLSASSYPARVSWYENLDGAGNFGPQQLISTTLFGPYGVAAADLDGDGDMDVLAAGDDLTALWCENLDGVGTFGPGQVLSTSLVGAGPVTAADLSGDGYADILAAAGAGNGTGWFENRGGQFSLATSGAIDSDCCVPRLTPGCDDPVIEACVCDWDSWCCEYEWYEDCVDGVVSEGCADDCPVPDLENGETDAVLRVSTTHEGRMGDTDLELVTFDLLFEESPGDPLSSVEANALFQNLFVYLDDGSDSLEVGTDTLVTTVDSLVLDAGVQTVNFVDADPNVRIGQGAPRTYFVVLEMTSDAAGQTPNTFQLIHLTESTSSAEDADHDIPLTLAFVENYTSVSVVAVLEHPKVVSVSPQDNELDVPAVAHVAVSFSKAVNPATVTSGNLHLLDSTGSQVPATLAVSPAGLHATLDPDALLPTDSIFTLKVTSGVQDPVGTPALSFESRFRTMTTPLTATTLPSVADLAPGLAPQSHLGSAVAGAGDLNGDDINDFIAGAPGLDVGANAAAGAVAVYLGSGTMSERIQPDIIFRGEAAHDRAGVSVAGNFDFNGDGVPDILIGAEQMDRTDADPANHTPTGAGKVYLIFFDPTDTVHYPNLGNPLATDIVDLAQVGVTIPGVVFTGESVGDRAGYAVDGGGQVNAGTGQDLLIGAPGRDTDPGGGSLADAGTVYVIFDDPLMTGTISLSRVANGLGDQVEGILYQGSHAGSQVGHAVRFVGDVVQPAVPPGPGREAVFGGDIAFGAPYEDGLNDQGQPVTDGGTVFIVEADDEDTDSIFVDSLGITEEGAQIKGTQVGEYLGWSVANGGDSRVNGVVDLLGGAPGYDVDIRTDAGRVVHTSTLLTSGIYLADEFGTTQDGLIWTGLEAGDRLGEAVAGVGDVTGDGLVDVAMAAPYADPVIDSVPVTDAGVVYVAAGVIPSVGTEGTISVGEIGTTVPGVALSGTQAGEHAGASMAGTGDVSDDGRNDFVVGAPDHEVTDDGLVYIVLDIQAEQVGSCGPQGCTIVDLETGAQLSVPPGSLDAPADLAVKGILRWFALPAPVPEGTLYMGAADFDVEGQVFGAPLPTIHVPTLEDMQDQLPAGQSVSLWSYDGADWVESAAVGTVQANPHYPAHAAIEAHVNALHFYALFVTDDDDDGYGVTVDCDDSYWATYPGAHEYNDGLDNQCPGDPGYGVIDEISGTSLFYDYYFPKEVFTWPWQSGASQYQAARSDRPDFVDCVTFTTSETSWRDTEVPPLGSTFYYLVRSTWPNVGSWGQDSTGAERVGICP